MPGQAPYLPPRDADFDVWLANFSTLLTANPNLYGQTSGVASSIATAYTAWHSAYLLAIGGSTRGPFTVSQKDDQRVNASAVVRPIATTISLNAGVAANDKIAIGVNPRTSGLTPIAAPTSNPVLSLIGAQHLAMFFRYRDDQAPAGVRSKPFGVTQLQLFGATSTTVVSDQATLPLIGVYTKVPVMVAWQSSDVGKTAYIAARWQTRTGLVGPWSPIFPITVI